MKSERILNALGGAKEEYIAEAAPGDEKQNKSRRLRMKWGTLAACAAAVFAGICFVPQLIPTAQELPMLTIGENSFSGGMGYEGLMAYDSSELINANPWMQEEEADTLPVYKNHLYYDENYRLRGHDPEAMQVFLLEIAGRLGMDTENLTITDNVPDEEQQTAYREKVKLSGRELPEDYFYPTLFKLEDEQYSVEVDQQMTATVTFKEPAVLPESCNFRDTAQPEELYETAQYLLEKYRTLIGMEDPQINISGGSRNIYGEQHYSVSFYEGAGTLPEQIVQYHFSTAVFYNNSEGALGMVRIYRYDRSEKLGDYPVITVQEARELLLAGGYITSVPFELPGEEYIVKAELVYRTGLHDFCFMPYYKFYAELPEAGRPADSAEGLITYGAYYVPAVESEYITDMPVWDGSFN